VDEVKHGRWLAFWSISLTLLALPTSLLAEDIEVLFRWTPSPAIDEEGHFCAPAIAYEVYHQRNDGPVDLIATVTDTSYTLAAERGIRHRIRVLGVDAQQRQGQLSEWSPEVYFEPEIEPIDEVIPKVPGLLPNFPNPFNPETSIVYGIPEATGGNVRAVLEIYNIQGRRIRSLTPNTSPGWHQKTWDGKDDSGAVQPTGQYIVRFSCNGQVKTNKMTMVK
jgi:hypothetical protein